LALAQFKLLSLFLECHRSICIYTVWVYRYF